MLQYAKPFPFEIGESFRIHVCLLQHNKLHAIFVDRNGKIENLSSVARRHAEAGISFGERPSTPSLRILPSGADVRMLSESGGERPGDLRSGDGGSPERISAGRD